MRKDHLGHHAPVGRVNLAKNAQRCKTVKVRRVLFASTKKEPELTPGFLRLGSRTRRAERQGRTGRATHSLLEVLHRLQYRASRRIAGAPSGATQARGRTSCECRRISRCGWCNS